MEFLKGDQPEPSYIREARFLERYPCYEGRTGALLGIVHHHLREMGKADALATTLEDAHEHLTACGACQKVLHGAPVVHHSEVH
jgi:hypothetical protein